MISFLLLKEKNDAHKYLNEVFKNKASIAVVQKTVKNNGKTKQIKVNNTLRFLTDCAKVEKA